MQNQSKTGGGGMTDNKKPIVVICCCCHRVKQPDGTFAPGSYPADAKLSHGYCPACYAVEMAKVRKVDYRARAI
jgi:hypothetical protein